MSNNIATSGRLVPKGVHTKMWELDSQLKTTVILSSLVVKRLPCKSYPLQSLLP